MATPQDDPRLRSPWMLAQLASVAIVITSVIHLGVCIVLAHVASGEGGFGGFIAPAEDASGIELYGMVRLVLAGISLPLVVAAFYARAAVKRRPATVQTRGPFPLPDTPEGKAVGRLIPATLVSMAVAEAPGIFGLAMFIIMGNFAWLGAFLGVAFVAKIALFPRWSEVEEMVEVMVEAERLEKLA